MVCVISDVINYSVDRMVLVSLNLNEHRMPPDTVSVWTLHILQNEGFSWLNLYKLVIFRYISTNVGVKVCILLFNSCVKFHSKICTYCWNMNKKLISRWDSERELFTTTSTLPVKCWLQYHSRYVVSIMRVTYTKTIHVLQPTIEFTSFMESTHVHSCQMRLLQL